MTEIEGLPSLCALIRRWIEAKRILLNDHSPGANEQWKEGYARALQDLEDWVDLTVSA